MVWQRQPADPVIHSSLYRFLFFKRRPWRALPCRLWVRESKKGPDGRGLRTNGGNEDEQDHHTVRIAQPQTRRTEGRVSQGATGPGQERAKFTGAPQGPREPGKHSPGDEQPPNAAPKASGLLGLSLTLPASSPTGPAFGSRTMEFVSRISWLFGSRKQRRNVLPRITPQGSRKVFRRAVTPSSRHGTEKQQSEA